MTATASYVTGIALNPAEFGDRSKVSFYAYRDLLGDTIAYYPQPYGVNELNMGGLLERSYGKIYQLDQISSELEERRALEPLRDAINEPIQTLCKRHKFFVLKPSLIDYAEFHWEPQLRFDDARNICIGPLDNDETKACLLYHLQESGLKEGLDYRTSHDDMARGDNAIKIIIPAGRARHVAQALKSYVNVEAPKEIERMQPLLGKLSEAVNHIAAREMRRENIKVSDLVHLDAARNLCITDYSNLGWHIGDCIKNIGMEMGKDKDFYVRNSYHSSEVVIRNRNCIDALLDHAKDPDKPIPLDPIRRLGPGSTARTR